MNTAQVAAAAGCSVQLVRDLEAAGVLVPAERSRNGYRRFTEAHARDLRTYRELAAAVGPADARRVIRQLRSLPADEAASLVCSLSARLDLERHRTLAARDALAAIQGEAATEAEALEGDAMTITELAQALRVRPSALRFWESVGLVAPERIATRAGTARRYHLDAIREARVTAALRAGGYRVPEVQVAIAAMRELGDAADSRAALDARLRSIGERQLALLRAGSGLAEVIARI